jgi:RNA polymerase sigma-70 factor (ECF subfamily)
MQAALQSIYLLFNEGYNSSTSDTVIRKDLCYEAMRLCILLTENEKTNLPETRALLALMCYNASRFDARIDEHGYIVLLKDQDRSKWNKELIQKGHYFMQNAGEGQSASTYHIEAAISSFHCIAPSFEKTEWGKILFLYDNLVLRNPSPIIQLNRAIALAYAVSKQKAIEEIKQILPLQNHYLYNATLGDLYFETGQAALAKAYFEKAIELTYSPQEKELLKNKIGLTLKA